MCAKRNLNSKGLPDDHRVLFVIVQGIRDLFCLPFEQYKKDGRFLRGLHRGANSFTTSTAMAALELTTRLIHLIQVSHTTVIKI